MYNKLDNYEKSVIFKHLQYMQINIPKAQVNKS